MSENAVPKYCRNCGQEIDADSRFCSTCGKNIQAVQKEPEDAPHVKKSRSWSILNKQVSPLFYALGALIFVVVMGSITSGGTGSGGKFASVKQILTKEAENLKQAKLLRRVWQEKDDASSTNTSSSSVLTQIDLRQPNVAVISIYATGVSEDKSTYKFQSEIRFSVKHDVNMMYLKIVDEKRRAFFNDEKISEEELAKTIAETFPEYNELVDWLKANDLVFEVKTLNDNSLVLHESYPEFLLSTPEEKNELTHYAPVPDSKAISW